MRWHVHGTDPVTGQPVELKVDEAQAQQAIKAALERQIVVNYVTPGEGQSRRHWRVPVAVALFVALAALAGGLGVQNMAFRGTLRQALAEQKQMSSSVAQAEHLAADIRAHGNLAESAQTQVTQLADELAAARKRMSLTEAQLSAAHNELSGLEKDAQRVPGLEKQATALQGDLAAAQNQLAQSRRLTEQLRGELALQGRRLEQLGNAQPAVDSVAAARVAALEKANQALAAELDGLKSELLIAAAQSTAVAAPAPAAETVANTATTRWALRVSYDAARVFLVLHSDDSTLSTTATVEGLAASVGMLPANAVQVRFVHDRAKERVYSATLSASLAADAPREKLAENRQMIAGFLQTFAPGLKDVDAVVTAATGQLASLDETRRLVYRADDCKVTIWNNKTGVFTFRVESARGELE